MITSYVSNAFLSLLEHLVDVIAPRLCWRSVSICFSRCQNSKAHILTLEDWLMTSVLQSSSVGSIHVSHLHLARAPVASSTLPLSVTSVSLSISKTSSTILPSFLGSIHCSKWSTHVRHSFCPSFFFSRGIVIRIVIRWAWGVIFLSGNFLFKSTSCYLVRLSLTKYIFDWFLLFYGACIRRRNQCELAHISDLCFAKMCPFVLAVFECSVGDTSY